MIRSSALSEPGPALPTPSPAASGPAATDAPPAPMLEVRDLVDAVRRRGLMIGSSVVLVSAAALGLYKLQPPAYTSTARVLVQTDQLGTPSFLSGIAAYRESQLADPVTRKLETEMALMATRGAAEDVVSRFGIGPAELPASPLAALLRRAGTLLAPWLAPAEPPALAARVDAFLAQVAIEPVRSKTAETTSNVVELKFDSTDRALAPKVLAALLDAYLVAGMQEGARLGRSTIDLLATQVAEAQRELQGADAAITTLAVRESARAGSLAAAGAAAGLAGPRGEADPSVAQMMAQTVQLQGQLDEQRGTFTDETPIVRSARQRLDEARGRLVAHLKASATAGAEFNRLERQRALLQDRYLELRRKLDQIELYTAMNPTTANGRVVVDRPTLPTPKSAHRSKALLVLGPLAGLLLGLLLAAAREISHQRLRTRRDVERALGLPLLGALPILRTSR